MEVIDIGFVSFFFSANSYDSDLLQLEKIVIFSNHNFNLLYNKQNIDFKLNKLKCQALWQVKVMSKVKLATIVLQFTL